MKIKIIQLGKEKDSFVEDGVNVFLKRLKPYAKIEMITLKSISPSKTYTPEKCVKEEGEQILKNIDESSYRIVLDEKGKSLNSAGFSELLKSKSDTGKTITFIIGGAFGLSDEVKAKADYVFSMSELTFTHQMIRIFLLEQIYRSICIIRGKEYHIA